LLHYQGIAACPALPSVLGTAEGISQPSNNPPVQQAKGQVAAAAEEEAHDSDNDPYPEGDPSLWDGLRALKEGFREAA